MSSAPLWTQARERARQLAAGPDPRDFPPADTAPPSEPQLRLLRLDALHPGRTTQNLQFAYHLRGGLDSAALEHALAGVWARHQGLRAHFPGYGEQRFHDAETFELARPATSGPGSLESALAWAQTLAGEPYRLDRDRLWRAGVYPIDTDEQLLVLAAHHAVFDAWSLSIVHRELAAAYGRGGEVPPAPSRASYAQYVLWQRARLADPAITQPLLVYWERRLAGRPGVGGLEPDAARSGPPGPRRRRARALDPESAGALRDLAAAHDTSLFAVLFAGCAALVSERTGAEDFVVMSPSSGRIHPALHDLAGYFVNLHALRADVTGAPDFATLLGRCARGIAGALEHEEFPIQMAAALYGRPSDFPPLLFGLQNTPQRALELDGLSVTPVELNCGQADFGVHLNAEPSRNGGLTIVATYDGDRYSEESTDALLGEYVSTLARFGSDPTSRLGGRTRPAGTNPGEPSEPGEPVHEPRARVARAPAAASDPLGYLEHQIAELTGAAEIDPERAPLALGLDSLKLIELSTRVSRDIGVDAPLQAYARAASVRALAEDLLLLLTLAGSSSDEPNAEVVLL